MLIYIGEQIKNTKYMNCLISLFVYTILKILLRRAVGDIDMFNNVKILSGNEIHIEYIENKE